MGAISYPQGQPSSKIFGEWTGGGSDTIRRSPTQKKCRAIFRDERAYSNPHTYDPERYLNDGKLDYSVKDPEKTVFGFGRRC